MSISDPLLDLLTARMSLRRDEAAGQTALVTGAGRGIGRQAALAFGLLGANVVVAELSDEGEQTAVEIINQGGEAIFVRTDVSDPGSVSALSEEVQAAYGRVDVLVNNAILCPAVGFTEMNLEQWDRVMAVNLRGTFLTCQAFLPGMLERSGGVIINMVSTDAMPGLSAYIASKQGLVGLSQSLDLETFQRGVCAIPFAPGMVDTPGIRAAAEGLAPRLGMTNDQFMSASLHPAYEGLMPAEHAGAATIYLALRLAKECHGQVTNGYEVLERAGVISSEGPEPIVVTDAERPDTPPLMVDDEDVTPQEALAGLIRELGAELMATGNEFEKLPIFVRPIARQGFKRKTGLSLEAWQDALDVLAKNPDASLPGLAARLDGLCEYFRGVPAETARFTKDVDFLRQVNELAARRVTLVQQLRMLLESRFG